MTTRLTLLFVLSATAAHASDVYPLTIQGKYDIDPVPQQCALCHTNGITGFGTVNTPFGVTLRDRGLTSADEVLLDQLLDELEAEGTDSDSDGTSDIDELRAGTDPSYNEELGLGPDGLPKLQWGCGAQVAPHLFAAAGLALLLRRRRFTSKGRPAP